MRGVLGLMLFVALAAPVAGATTYLVRPDGTGDFPTIQAAIVAATDGDVIQLTNGVFRGDGNRDIDYLQKSIIIRSQSGQPDLCTIDCEGSSTAPHRGFLISVWDGSDTALEGVTVLNGYAGDGSGGGAVVCDGSTVALRHCIFLSCHARAAGGCVSSLASYVDIIACAFLDSGVGDEADGGGGLYVAGRSVYLEDCSFERNSAAHNGGAVFAEWGTPVLSLVRCQFRDNRASFLGGAVSCARETITWMADCVFVGNSSGYGGGAVDVDHFAGDNVCAMQRCSFYDNHANQEGGAVNVWYSSGDTRLTDCTLYRNSAAAGGGIHGGSNVYLANVIIAASESGGALVADGTPEIMCTDIYGNAGGDWVGYIAGQYGINGNISADPLFCDPAGENFTLQEGSPCGPDYNPACGLIGAWPVGCSGTPVERTTWGGLKALFR